MSRIPLSLTFDHQILDGAGAAEFLKVLAKYIENHIYLFYNRQHTLNALLNGLRVFENYYLYCKIVDKMT